MALTLTEYVPAGKSVKVYDVAVIPLTMTGAVSELEGDDGWPSARAFISSRVMSPSYILTSLR